MSSLPQLPDILETLHENQLALADAIESIAMWIDQRGSTGVSSTALGAIATLDLNAESVRKGIEALRKTIR
ncbi:hypothetical protein HP062_04820 [Pseudomonas sp. B14-6]|jgi:hypothetical protein|uniref:hypothetical protein n=1 Tax=Pseudomonas sp. B14-6 TaxID=2738843 RepID=UPI00155ED26B|nr:hypothetical protein [Pseudomonas sp. B14-6]QKG64965.1 hypothetical protein HP062_04820 [Pseudomonas sp. B14-6]